MQRLQLEHIIRAAVGITGATLLLLGFLQAIRAQENPVSSIRTNRADVTEPRFVKLNPNAGAAMSGSQKKKKQPQDAKYGTLTLSSDTKAPPFNAYNRAVIADVKSRWCDLLDGMKYDGSNTGKVVLQFQLYHNGRIAELKRVETTTDERLTVPCQQAILDSSPSLRWPKEMHKQIGADYRTMTLTFQYLPDKAHPKER